MKRGFFLFFSLLLLIGCGNNNSSTRKNIEMSPYGEWEICDYTDDFDEPTGEKFVRQIIQGYFSNSATASSPLKVYLYLFHNYNSFSDNHYVDGKILFDEYLDGTEDFHIWRDASPAKYGTKIIDKANKKSYYYEERIGFLDKESGEQTNWIDILRDTISTYNFTIKGEFQDEYRFSVNSDKLNDALNDAGILKDVSR